ncbi:MAG: tetratricopeptide repeat protein [Mariprofundaceae bacterium]
MIRFILVSVLILGLTSGLAMAEPSGRVQGVRIFLNQGNPEQAIQTAGKLLSTPKLSEDDRFALLELIAEAEEFRTASSHYQDVSKAIAAIKTLIREFPDDIDESALLWKIAYIHWRNGADKLSMTTARALKDRFHDSDYAIKALLLMARIHINQKKYDLARNDLLQHGLRVADESRAQRLGKVWIAVVDFEESRFDESYHALDEVYLQHPTIIEAEERLFATYIRMLQQYGKSNDAIVYADKFLKRYSKGDYVPHVRLLHADMLSEQQGVDLDAIRKEYELIAIGEAETTVGKKAFMRKMILQYRDSKDYMTLKPVIIALKRIANQNQLSEVENESILHQARLWVRAVKEDADHAPRQATTAALENYAKVASSPFPMLVEQALEEGKLAFVASVEKLIAEEKWMQVVVVWERFPQLRPKDRSASQLQYGVAHALRMLMEYEQAEVLLEHLYQLSSDSVWGHKVMLERVRLWLDRGDTDGVERVMAWLSEHEFTLYRPEMLLLAARMQLKSGNASAASQTIVSVAAADVALEERGAYWKAQANIAEKLSRWHVAAHAWRQYGKIAGADKGVALMEQANSLFKAADYHKAEVLYETISAEERTAAWEYRFSICQINSGKLRQATERLERLKTDKKAGVYASLAALALAERQADDLLEMHP